MADLIDMSTAFRMRKIKGRIKKHVPCCYEALANDLEEFVALEADLQQLKLRSSIILQGGEENEKII